MQNPVSPRATRIVSTQTLLLSSSKKSCQIVNGIRHLILARRAIEKDMLQGRRLYQAAQAASILMIYYYSEARWLDGWTNGGFLFRLIIPLGLLFSSSHTTMEESPRCKYSRPMQKLALLPPPNDDVEREERRALLWSAIIWDVYLGAASGLPGNLPINEIVSHCESHPYFIHTKLPSH